MNIDYDYYSNIYRGNIIPVGDHVKYLRKAESYVGSLIFGRDPGDHTESVKLAVCNVAELLYLDESRQGITSENVDGYSVSYAESDIEKSIYDATAVYLADSGLMYAGVSE
ncbi:MAG: hypothetical protein IKT39_03440 [Clostridia bacterium]|nr:hypothetical protein [Clostridia bacterium]